MKLSTFKVEFLIGVLGEGPFSFVLAVNGEQAKILAQAERIKLGLDYRVEHVWIVH